MGIRSQTQGSGGTPDADEVLICKTVKILIFKGSRCININYHYVHIIIQIHDLLATLRPLVYFSTSSFLDASQKMHQLILPCQVTCHNEHSSMQVQSIVAHPLYFSYTFSVIVMLKHCVLLYMLSMVDHLKDKVKTLCLETNLYLLSLK